MLHTCFVDILINFVQWNCVSKEYVTKSKVCFHSETKGRLFDQPFSSFKMDFPRLFVSCKFHHMLAYLRHVRQQLHPVHLQIIGPMSAFPKVPGPKLKRFGSDSRALDIEFIEHLGKGIHGHVWKVRIDSTVYALKIVCKSLLAVQRTWG